jgi:hypothetical protein
MPRKGAAGLRPAVSRPVVRKSTDYVVLLCDARLVRRVFPRPRDTPELSFITSIVAASMPPLLVRPSCCSISECFSLTDAAWD